MATGKLGMNAMITLGSTPYKVVNLPYTVGLDKEVDCETI